MNRRAMFLAAVSWSAAILCLAGMLTLGSCGSSRQLSTDEVELVAWFIEDVAHGHPRRPEELEVTNPTPTMRRIISWLNPTRTQTFLANGELAHPDYEPPNRLLARRNRWVSLRELFLSQVVVELPSGLVAVRPGVPDETAVSAYQVIDAENLDRRELDALVITTANLVNEAQTYFLEQSALARVTLDRQAGAQLWEGKDHPQSR